MGSADKLRDSRVLVAGIGGVGSYVAEGLLRSGIGTIGVVDFDDYELSNMNRQLYATERSVGKSKVACFTERASLINPEANIKTYGIKLSTETIEEINFSEYDFVVDAIDDIKAKMLLIKTALDSKCGLISAMGAGNKIRPELLKISTIYNTKVCPLAKIIRKEARALDLPDFSVVYSEEEIRKCSVVVSEDDLRRSSLDVCRTQTSQKVVGSAIFVPAAMGIIMASYVVNTLIGQDG